MEQSVADVPTGCIDYASEYFRLEPLQVVHTHLLLLVTRRYTAHKPCFAINVMNHTPGVSSLFPTSQVPNTAVLIVVV
jgi:hypothetical protein